MKVLKIGILDEEEYYVDKLAAYLNRQGSWSVSAFTDKQVLIKHLEKRELDILAGTDKEEILELKHLYQNLCLIWLTEQEVAEKKVEAGTLNFYPLFRYQSAKVIGKRIGEIADQLSVNQKIKKRMVAFYSPVGRCGKTSLALETVKKGKYGRWLYVGMEDYSFFEEEGKNPDVFFYFVKERKEDKVLEWMEQSEGLIPSASSPFDTKQLEKEDLEWLQKVLEKCEYYRGGIFDIGTGVLKDFNLFLVFDALIVPYLTEKKAMVKKEKFERMLKIYGLDDVMEKIWFINMEREEEINEKMEAVFRLS